MLSPSIESSSSSLFNRQKKTVTNDTASEAQQSSPAQQVKLADSHHTKVTTMDDKATPQQRPHEPLQALDESAFNTDASPTSYTNYTLKLNDTAYLKAEIKAKVNLKPDEVRFGRKRPALPITFSFGVRRPLTLAIAMRHPILEGKQPTTTAQAILDTFDLAATNRLPYIKGSEINLAT